MTSKEIEKELTSKRPSQKWSTKELLSSGSTILNCAISDSPWGAFLPGEFIMYVGGSESGKTAFYHQAMAEAANDPKFDDYDIYVDDSEGGALFNISKFWGKKLNKRLKAPRYEEGKPKYSSTIEEMFDTLDDLCDKGKPFIFAEDSIDALFTKDEENTRLKQKVARKKGTKIPSSYGTDRARRLSTGLRHLRHKIRDLRAMVFLIFQERINIGSMMKGDNKTHGGGLAPKFYSNLQLWFNIRQRITKKVGDALTDLGIETRIKIKKNRLTGKHRTINLPFYYDSGFDDLGSCVDFLVACKHWKKGSSGIYAPEFDLKLSKEKLIHSIEDNGEENILRATVGEVWKQLEGDLTIKRKRRYL